MLAVMITFEGAKLLAQLIPVLILLVGVHRQWLGPQPVPVSTVGQVWYWVKGFGQGVGAGGCVVSLVPLFGAVNAQEDITGGIVWFIFASVYAVGFASIDIVVSLVTRSYFNKEEMERYTEERLQLARAARDARRVQRLERKALRDTKGAAMESAGGMDPQAAQPSDRPS